MAKWKTSLNSGINDCSLYLHMIHLNVIISLVMPLSFMHDSGNRKIHRRHSTGDFPFRHTVMYNWRIAVQIIHKAIYLQHPLPEITILSILSTELSQVVEGLKPNLQDVTCKFEGSSFAPLSVHLSVYFNIKCSLSCSMISYFQRLWLIWHDSRLIRAQTPACSAGMQLGEPLYIGYGLLYSNIWFNLSVFHLPFQILSLSFFFFPVLMCSHFFNKLQHKG